MVVGVRRGWGERPGLAAGAGGRARTRAQATRVAPGTDEPPGAAGLRRGPHLRRMPLPLSQGGNRLELKFLAGGRALFAPAALQAPRGGERGRSRPRGPSYWVGARDWSQPGRYGPRPCPRPTTRGPRVR